MSDRIGQLVLRLRVFELRLEQECLGLELLRRSCVVLSENVKVRLDLSGLVPDPSSLELRVLSPDEIRPQLADLSVHRNVIEFTLRRIEHYTVVTFSNGVRP